MTARDTRRFVAAFAITLVVAGVIGGLIILGPPSQERVNRLDERRVADLQQIEAAVNLYWTRHSRLPASLEELAREAGVRLSVRDPGMNQAYEYRPLDETTFELCATFESALPPEARSAGFWSHGSGRQCFQPKVREVKASTQGRRARGQ